MLGLWDCARLWRSYTLPQGFEMFDWQAMIIVVAVFAGWTYFLVFGVLLALRPAWTIEQRWSPVNRERMRRSHERFRFGMDPDRISDSYYRFLGVFFLAFLAMIPLSLFGGEAGQTLRTIFIGLFSVWVLLSTIAVTFLPFSVLKRMPWLTPCLPADGEGLWIRRATGALILVAIGTSIYSAAAG